MQTERHIQLFRNGRNQALRIPREFELEAKEAIIYKKGNTLVIKPVKNRSILQLLSEWQDEPEELPEVDDPPIQTEDIF